MIRFHDDKEFVDHINIICSRRSMMYGIDYQYQIGLCVLNLLQCPYPYGY